MPDLRLYNSLTREKEVFKPLDPGHVRLYACGPTVYNFAHIGNARMAVVFDLLALLLRRVYPKVTYASNITDVDDKIIDAARESGEAIDFITRKYERIYNEDMAALGVAQPDVQPRATEHIPEMIKLIETLIAKNHAYAKDGHVLFNVPSFPAYGGLSGRSRDEQVAGARVEVAPYKKDPADFVLWKPSDADQPGWDSPWGRGRPGWHIECSAMSEKHLGLPFDIHGGGADLKFPHHENEIAQSCCAHGSENDLSGFAKYWVHNGFVTVSGEKMSKSLGNVVLVHDFLPDDADGIARSNKGEVVRFALLSAHYRQPLDWSGALMTQCFHTLNSLYDTIENFTAVPEEKINLEDSEIFKALCDDLNTPKAISELHAVATRLKKAPKEEQGRLKAELKEGGRLLGILQKNPKSWRQSDTGLNAQEIESLLQAREQARKDRNFKRADEIRDELTAKGVTIEDTAEGPKWRKSA